MDHVTSRLLYFFFFSFLHNEVWIGRWKLRADQVLLTLTATNLCMSYGIITMVSPFTKMPLMKGNLKDASWVDSSLEFCSFICIGPQAFTSRLIPALSSAALFVLVLKLLQAKTSKFKAIVIVSPKQEN